MKMMRQLKTFFKPLLLVGCIAVIAAWRQPMPTSSNTTKSVQVGTLKQAALSVLQTKCNVCHRKQNPFKVFSVKNMEKHASKIHKQVFVKQRMPKGDIKLTTEEYSKLKEWLLTQTIK